MSTWQRIAIRYMSIWLAGTFAVVFAIVPVVRMHIVRTELDAADQLLGSRRPGDALAKIQRVEFWAALYPTLAHRLTGSAIRCHVRLSDIVSAKRYAWDFLDRCGAGRPSRNPVEFLQAIPDGILNACLASMDDSTPASRWTGFEVLAAELQQAGDWEEMDRLAREMLGKDPGNSLARRVRDIVARKREQQAKKDTPPPAPPPEPAKVEAPKKRVDHAELARKRIAAKQWDKALEECDAALALDPQDAQAIALKKIAQARDLKWGCTTAVAKAYDASGKPVLELPPGTLVDVSGIRSSPSVGDLAVCRAITETNELAEVLVRVKDLDLRMGPLSQAPEEEKAFRVQRAKLIAEIDRLKSDLAKASMKDNPFKPAYDAAAAAYNAYWAKERQLEAKHRAATGDARVALADELKKMKFNGDDERVGKALEAAKKKLIEWQEKRTAAPVTDPKVKALEDQLAGLQTRIQSLDNER